MSVKIAIQHTLTMNPVEDLNFKSSGGFDAPFLREKNLSLILGFLIWGAIDKTMSFVKQQ
jgi:hypothetical protein